MCMHDFIMHHDKHSICAFLPFFVAALGHSSKIFAKHRLSNLCRRRIVHQLFVACYGATSDRMDHWVRVMLKIHWDFGMLHERAWCVNNAEQSLLPKGKYVHDLLCYDSLLCTGGDGSWCGLWPAMRLDA